MAGTGLSSHELNQPGTYVDVSDTSVTAQFKIINETLPEKYKDDSDIFFLLGQLLLGHYRQILL